MKFLAAVTASFLALAVLGPTLILTIAATGFIVRTLAYLPVVET